MSQSRRHEIDEPPLTLAAKRRVDRVCIAAEDAWQSGDTPQLEQYLGQTPEPERSLLLSELLRVELYYLERRGEKPDLHKCLCRFPDHARVIDEVFEGVSLVGTSVRDVSLTETATGTPPGQRASKRSRGQKIDRYVIEETLGSGGFGTVYLARDEQLDRQVAVKVPRRERFECAEEAGRFLDEARTVAALKHPGIVSVYDTGRDDEGMPFVVIEYVDGGSLKERLQSGPLPVSQCAELVACIGETIAYAHREGFVHRDLKPANILLDTSGRPHVADFGLAVHESVQRVHAGEHAGTLAYMAPEQVRGEAHRIDGRADIWGLGVIFYEMLTGRTPFEGVNRDELADEILHREPKPPRQIEDKIPEALERACLRCLAKQVTDRYATANDLADDLRRWLRPARSARDRAIWILSATVLLLVGAGLGTTLFRSLGDGRPSADVTLPPRNTPAPRLTAEEFRKLLEQHERQRAETREGLPRKPANLPGAPSAAGAAPASTGSLTAMMLTLPGKFPELGRQIAEARRAAKEETEYSLLLRATNDLVGAGDFAVAEVAARRMVELAGNDPGRRPIALGQLGLAQYRAGNAEEAIGNLQESIRIYRTLYDRLQKLPPSEENRSHLSQLARLLGLAMLRVGNAQKYLKSYQSAHGTYEEAMQLLRRHDRNRELVTLLISYGGLESQRGNYTAAVSLLRQGLELARRDGDKDSEAELHVNLGNARARSGDNPSALEHYQAANALLSAGASQELRATLYLNWIITLFEEKRLHDARQHLEALKRIVGPDDERFRRLFKLLGSIPGLEAG